MKELYKGTGATRLRQAEKLTKFLQSSYLRDLFVAVVFAKAMYQLLSFKTKDYTDVFNTMHL